MAPPPLPPDYNGGGGGTSGGWSSNITAAAATPAPAASTVPAASNDDDWGNSNWGLPAANTAPTPAAVPSASDDPWSNPGGAYDTLNNGGGQQQQQSQQQAGFGMPGSSNASYQHSSYSNLESATNANTNQVIDTSAARCRVCVTYRAIVPHQFSHLISLGSSH